jgi:hypothetical protein
MWVLTLDLFSGGSIAAHSNAPTHQNANLGVDPGVVKQEMTTPAVPAQVTVIHGSQTAQAVLQQVPAGAARVPQIVTPQVAMYQRPMGIQQQPLQPVSQGRPFPQGIPVNAPGKLGPQASSQIPIPMAASGMMPMDTARHSASGMVSIVPPGAYPGTQAQQAAGHPGQIQHGTTVAADGAGMKRQREEKEGDGDGDGKKSKTAVSAAEAGKKGEDSDDDTRFDVLAVMRRNKTLGEDARNMRASA